MVEASARVGLLLTRAVYGRHRPGLPWPHIPRARAGWLWRRGPWWAISPRSSTRVSHARTGS